MNDAANAFSIGHYQKLLDELCQAVVTRSEAERLLAADRAPDDALSPLRFERRLEALADEHRQAVAAAEAEHTAARQALDDQHQGTVASIRAEYARATAEIESEFNAGMAQIEKKHEENCWLLSSILDDKSENSPNWQFETLRTQIQQSRESLALQSEEVKRLYEQALELVENRPYRVGPEPEAGPLPRNREEALRAIGAAAEVVREQSQRLARQVAPRLASGRVLPVSGLVVWGGLFAATFWPLAPQMFGFSTLSSGEWALLCGGAAFAVAGVLMLVIRQITAQQTADAFEPLQQNAIDAAALYQCWLKLARDDLSRGQQAYEKRQAALAERRDKSVEQFDAARDDATRALEAGRRREFHAAAQAREAAIREATENREHEMAAAEAANCEEAAAREVRFEQEHARLSQEYEQQTGARGAQRQELWDRAVTGWKSTVMMLEGECASLAEMSRRLFPAWDEIASPGWQPAGELPPGVRLGDYLIGVQNGPNEGPAMGEPSSGEATCRLPAVLPFPGLPSLVLKVSGAGRALAVAVMQTAMLRLLTQLPAGDVRFTIFDPVGLGENFAAFMHLADYDELLISHRIWTETAQIEDQLAKLTEHMENVFQKYLRNEFESIEEYNRHAGEVAEPYRVLVVANFPAGFSDRAAQRLVSIVASGPRCGVHTIFSIDTRQPRPHGFDPAHLEEEATVLEWVADESGKGQFVNRAFGRDPPPLEIDAPPAPPLLASLIRKMGEISKDVRRVEVPFHRIVPRSESFWTADSRAQIDVPLGRAGATKLQHLRLGSGTSQHVLVAGKTGSGKSTLLHVIVTDLALRYSPDEIEFYLIDFKKGVEFKTYAARRLPHARVIAIESDREFGTSVLERLDAVLKERGDLFRQQSVQDIASFRDARPDVRMPRILLIVDEFQEFFVEDDRYSQTAALLLDRLVRQGRAFGIHVLLGSQTLGGAYSLARTTIGQMAVRIALQCSDTDAHLILSDDNGAARLLTRPGEAIYNDANGMVEGNNPFQVAWLDDAQRDGFLDRVQGLAAERGKRWPEAIVFEGNIPADPSRNLSLCETIEAMTKPRQTDAGADSVPVTWLGDAVAITGPTTVTFNRRSGANLLIVGQDADAALGMLANSLFALLAQGAVPGDETSSGPPRMHLFAGDPPSSNPRRWPRILDVAPQQVRVSGPDDAGAAISELSAELARRQQDRSAAPPWFILIDDMSRFRDLRKSDDDYGFGGFDREKKATPGQLFGTLLRDGPPVGMHFLVWCDSYNNVDRWFSRQALREFEMRVAFQMSAADSSNLIDSPAASRLGTNRALLYSDERGTAEKFRPYGPLSDEWLKWLHEQLPYAKPDDLATADDINLWVVT